MSSSNGQSKNGKPKDDSPKKRKAGRPKAGDSPIPWEEYERLYQLYGTGHSFREIAKMYDVAHRTITEIFRTKIFPASQSNFCRKVEAELCYLDMVQRTAWRKFREETPVEVVETVEETINASNPEEPAQDVVKRAMRTVKRPEQKQWLDTVMSCIDMRCKLEGHYAAKRIQIDREEFRVAGFTPGELSNHMLQRLADKIDERRIYESNLRMMSGGPSVN